jgi:hypothetical protein
MGGVGFEPTKISLQDLKTCALNQALLSSHLINGENL